MSTYVVPNGATHAAGCVIHFKDGGEPEETVLCIGTLEECERCGELFPAVSYSGDRPVDRAEFVIVPFAASPSKQEEG